MNTFVFCEENNYKLVINKISDNNVNYVIEPKNTKRICYSDSYTYILKNNGKLLVCEAYTEGHHKEYANKLKLYKTFQDVKDIHCSNSSFYLLIIYNTGVMIKYAPSINRIDELETINENMIQYAYGLNFSLFLKDNGELWIEGQRIHEVLMTDKTIKQIMCSHYCIIILKENGEVWLKGTFGNNEYDDKESGKFYNELILWHVKPNIKQLCQSDLSLLYLTNDNELYVCKDILEEPQMIISNKNIKNAFMTCFNSTLIITLNNDDCYFFNNVHFDENSNQYVFGEKNKKIEFKDKYVHKTCVFMNPFSQKIN